MYFTSNHQTETRLKYQIDKANKKLLSPYCPPSLIQKLEERGILERIKNQILEDLFCFTAKDPAAKNCPQYILSSFDAPPIYRGILSSASDLI